MTSSVLGIILRARSSQTVTHSAQPLHLDGSMMIWNMPPELVFFLPASKYFLVRDHCLAYMSRSSAGRAASLACHSSSERTLPRMAVSGHSVTQSMQPVQFSLM